MADSKEVVKHDEPKTDAPKDMTPTPTQAEADEWKTKLYGGPDAKVEKMEAREEPEIITPRPTQAEADAAKIAAMGGDIGTPVIEEQKAIEHKKTVEADKPAGYQTRAARPKE